MIPPERNRRTNTEEKRGTTRILRVFPRQVPRFLAFIMSVFIGLILVFVSVLQQAKAAELKLTASDLELNVGQIWRLDLFLNAQGESINALEGRLTFDQNKLSLRSASDGNSIINLWITKPRLENNAVVFSGVIPGGYQDSGGLVLTATFEVKEAGTTEVALSDCRVLLNDGQGTPAVLGLTPLSLIISADQPTTLDLPQPDNDPPENFRPQIASVPELFAGRYFLSFATQDKGSGVAYYALYESRRKKDSWMIRDDQWRQVESPWLLSDQTLESYLYFKAVDLAGNERLVIVPPATGEAKGLSWTLIFGIIIGLIIIGGIALMFWLRIKPKLKNYHGRAGDKNKK